MYVSIYVYEFMYVHVCIYKSMYLCLWFLHNIICYMCGRTSKIIIQEHQYASFTTSRISAICVPSCKYSHNFCYLKQQSP